MSSSRPRILLVEDEANLAFNLIFNLQAEGYEVLHADDGLKALKAFQENGPFSAIILDVMLPEVDGYTIAKTIREGDERTGILMLTARAGDQDRVHGFESGVDDYLTKPFHLQELLLRVRRMIERSALLAPSTEAAPQIKIPVLRCGAFVLDEDALKIHGPQGEFDLTEIEAGMLREFMTNPGKILSRGHLLKQVWGIRGNVETRTVDNFILRLRRMLEADPKSPETLESIRGRGYRFNVNS